MHRILVAAVVTFGTACAGSPSPGPFPDAVPRDGGFKEPDAGHLDAPPADARPLFDAPLFGGGV